MGCATLASMRVGILTISDSGARGERVDTAGPAIAALMESNGNHVSVTALVPDDRDAIESTLKLWADDEHLDVVLTTGGTGLSPRDVTPEATLAVADKVVPGFAEAGDGGGDVSRRSHRRQIVEEPQSFGGQEGGEFGLVHPASLGAPGRGTPKPHRTPNPETPHPTPRGNPKGSGVIPDVGALA